MPAKAGIQYTESVAILDRPPEFIIGPRCADPLAGDDV
jgi:hypothetical protein